MEDMSPAQIAETIVNLATENEFCPIHFPMEVFEAFGESVAEDKQDTSMHWKIVMSYLVGLANAICHGHADKRSIAKHAIIDGLDTCKENGVVLSGVIDAANMPSTRSH